MCALRTRSVAKPGETCIRRQKLLSTSPEPMTSTQATASSPIARALRRRAAAGPGPRARVVVLERVPDIVAGGREDRREREEQAGDERHDGEEGEHADVDARLGDARHVGSRDPGQQARGPHREDEAGHAARPGERETLDEQLPRDPHAIGAQRETQRQLPPSRDGADQHQVADVRAADEQHHHHRHGQREERLPDVADDLLGRAAPASPRAGRWSPDTPSAGGRQWRPCRPGPGRRSTPGRRRATTDRKCSDAVGEGFRNHRHGAPVAGRRDPGSGTTAASRRPRGTGPARRRRPAVRRCRDRRERGAARCRGSGRARGAARARHARPRSPSPSSGRTPIAAKKFVVTTAPGTRTASPFAVKVIAPSVNAATSSKARVCSRQSLKLAGATA